MACDVSTVTTSVAANGIYGLEDRSLLLAMAGFLSGVTGLTASQAMALAAIYYGFDSRQIDEALLAVLCP